MPLVSQLMWLMNQQQSTTNKSICLVSRPFDIHNILHKFIGARIIFTHVLTSFKICGINHCQDNFQRCTNYQMAGFHWQRCNKTTIMTCSYTLFDLMEASFMPSWEFHQGSKATERHKKLIDFLREQHRTPRNRIPRCQIHIGVIHSLT